MNEVKQYPRIRLITRGLLEKQINPVVLQIAFESAVRKNPNDWFYNVEVDNQMIFIADNGEMGFTAMLPEEY